MKNPISIEVGKKCNFALFLSLYLYLFRQGDQNLLIIIVMMEYHGFLLSYLLYALSVEMTVIRLLFFSFSTLLPILGCQFSHGSSHHHHPNTFDLLFTDRLISHSSSLWNVCLYLLLLVFFLSVTGRLLRVATEWHLDDFLFNCVWLFSFFSGSVSSLAHVWLSLEQQIIVC